MSAAEWAEVGVRVIALIANLLVSCMFLYIMWRVYRHVVRPHFEKRGGGTPTGRIFLRSMFCSHRYVARVRDPYGRQYTACARCSTDVNSGKPPERWR